jgi:hypothetical protein
MAMLASPPGQNTSVIPVYPIHKRRRNWGKNEKARPGSLDESRTGKRTSMPRSMTSLTHHHMFGKHRRNHAGASRSANILSICAYSVGPEIFLQILPRIAHQAAHFHEGGSAVLQSKPA